MDEEAGDGGGRQENSAVVDGGGKEDDIFVWVGNKDVTTYILLNFSLYYYRIIIDIFHATGFCVTQQVKYLYDLIAQLTVLIT